MDNLINEVSKIEEVMPAIEKEHFITKNIYWDMWFQKLFAQLISVKIWIMALITVLLAVGLITSIEFASLFGVIMGLKGAFNLAEVWKSSPSELEARSIIKRV